MKRPAPNGATHLVLTAAQLCRRLLALVPPPRVNLTRFHGVFAPNARLRRLVAPAPPPPRTPDSKPTAATPAAASSAAPIPSDEQAPQHVRRVPWAELLRRSFGVDVLRCHTCGLRRTVLAFISHAPTARRILLHLQLPCGPPPEPEPPRNRQLTLVPVDCA
jgi:hypothetical protein